MTARAHLKAMSPFPWRAIGVVATILLSVTLIAGLLLSCAPASAPTPTAVGRLYHYVRSNQDGSLGEHIYQYRASETALEVGKQVSPCTNSAYVTAVFDPALGHGTEFVGGRLQRDLTQEAFAWLRYENGALDARIPSAGIEERVAVAGAPFIIYDFDLTDLNARFAGRAAPREDFRFAGTVIWIVEGADSIFRDLGWTDARFVGAETHLDREAVRYELSGGINGALWLDAREGHILEARFVEPNHTEYADFRLVLQNVYDNGAEAWRAARAAHWQGCPAEEPS